MHNKNTFYMGCLLPMAVAVIFFIVVGVKGMISANIEWERNKAKIISNTELLISEGRCQEALKYMEPWMTHSGDELDELITEANKGLELERERRRVQLQQRLSAPTHSVDKPVSKESDIFGSSR